MIHKRCTTHDHRVYRITADADRSHKAVMPMVGQLRIIMALVDPGPHEKRTEPNWLAGWSSSCHAQLASFPAGFLLNKTSWLQGNDVHFTMNMRKNAASARYASCSSVSSEP